MNIGEFDWNSFSWKLFVFKWKMKGRKHGEMSVAPLFPRLHVNDTEKGGPRPPPRNKMALYEQLSIPSQRVRSCSASTLPLPLNQATILPHTASPSLDGDQQRNVISPAHASVLEGFPKNTIQSSGNRSPKGVSEALYAIGKVSPAAKSSSFQPCNFSLYRSPFLKKHEEFRVPTFSNAAKRLGSSSNRCCTSKERSNTFDINTSVRHQSAGGASPDRPSYIHLVSEEDVKNQGGKHPGFSEVGKECSAKPPAVLAAKDNMLLDVCSNPLPENKVFRPSKQADSSSNQEPVICPAGDTGRLSGTKARISLAKQEDRHFGSSSVEQQKVLEKGATSVTRNESSDRTRRVNQRRRTPHLGDNGLEHFRSGSISWNHISDTTISEVLLTPDDIVKVIGQTHFWRARKAIINQQRLFSMQLFELHRLIKVQRAFSASPDIVLEDSLVSADQLVKPFPVKKSTKSLQVPEPSSPCPPPLRSKDESSKTVTPVENPTEKPPLPALNCNISNAAHSWTMWYCHPPPANQWLYPVMSPSEGLVYKPSTGPCPPPMGLMAPVYGGCGPLAATTAGGSLIAAAYGGPASHHTGLEISPGAPPLFQPYFAPYGTSAITSFLSQGVPQVMAAVGASSASNEAPLGMQDSDFCMPNQSSCNNEYCGNNTIVAKDTEVQGSTASSSPERIQKDALPLFPMMPVAHGSDQTDLTCSSGKQTQAIKVVPHKRRLASESAARIFHSIQEERKRHASSRSKN